LQDLKAIKKEMGKISKAKLPFVREEVSIREQYWSCACWHPDTLQGRALRERVAVSAQGVAVMFHIYICCHSNAVAASECLLHLTACCCCCCCCFNTLCLYSQVSAEVAEARIKAANEPYKLEILQVCVWGGAARAGAARAGTGARGKAGQGDLESYQSFHST
jgi:hypothetical protein